MGDKIVSHHDLEVYRKGFQTAMRIFQRSKQFPKEEVYSLTNQMRRSSRSVCANISEAWQKRRYAAAFVSKLNDAETEGAETQVWLEMAVACGYLGADEGRDLYTAYNEVLSMLVHMINHPQDWVIGQ